MLHSDFPSDDKIDITDIWSAETGERDCRVHAHILGSQISTVVVHGPHLRRMCRNGVIAVLSRKIVEKIEAKSAISTLC